MKLLQPIAHALLQLHCKTKNKGYLIEYNNKSDKYQEDDLKY